VPVIDQFAKEYLLDELRWTREAMLGTQDTPTSSVNNSTAP
jgi:hypothetical protein